MSPLTPPNPLASFLLAAFNASTTMVETLDSVRKQTHTRIEIIVVDDVPIDETARKAVVRASNLQTDQCAVVNSSQGHPVSRLDSDAPPSATRL